MTRAQLPHIDLILLSHAHFDHFDLATLRSLERAGTAVVTAKYTSDLLRVRRYQSVQEVGWGERVRVGPLSILGIRVKHWGARMRSDVHRGYNGYLIETARHRVVFGGDTALTDSFKAVRANEAGGSGDHADRRVRSVDSRALQSRAGLAHGRRLRRGASAAGASSDLPAEPRALSRTGGALPGGRRQPFRSRGGDARGARMVAQLTAKRLAVLLAAAGARWSLRTPREIVRKSVELDQSNWPRMKDYTWIARQTERSLDSRGQVKSEKTDEWETVVLYGEPHHRMLERDGKPLSAEDQRKEQAEAGPGRGEAGAGNARAASAARGRISKKSARRTASFCARFPTCSISSCWATKRSTATMSG